MNLGTNEEKPILIIDDQESEQQVLARSLGRLGVVNLVHRVGGVRRRKPA
jgi:ActR/RegA family two-component response regulator